MNTKYLALSSLLILTPFTVQAEDTGFYFGAGVGGSNYSDNLGRQIETAYSSERLQYHVVSAEMTDNSDTAFKVLGGYRFLPWLSVELAWVNLGTAHSHYQLGGTVTGDLFGEYRLHGVTAALAGQYALNDNFAISARAGLIASRLHYEEHGTVCGLLCGPASGSDNYRFASSSENQTRPMLGLGFSWKPETQWELRLDWDRYLGIGRRFNLTAEENGRFDNVDEYTLNLIYHFGG